MLTYYLLVYCLVSGQIAKHQKREREKDEERVGQQQRS